MIPLDATFNTLVLRLAPRFETISTQYESFEAMCADYHKRGILRVNTDYSENTIFGYPSVNWAFRAWHDSCHILANEPFSTFEVRTTFEQMRQIDALQFGTITDKQRWKALVFTEVIGQGQYFEKTGTFPVNQCEFVRQYMQDKFAIAL